MAIWVYQFVIASLRQTTTYIKVRGFEIPSVMRRSEKEKMVKFAKLQNGESDRQHFLKAKGFKFSARTDM